MLVWEKKGTPCRKTDWVGSFNKKGEVEIRKTITSPLFGQLLVTVTKGKIRVSSNARVTFSLEELVEAVAEARGAQEAARRGARGRLGIGE
jgi:hypothetical protein